MRVWTALAVALALVLPAQVQGSVREDLLSGVSAPPAGLQEAAMSFVRGTPRGRVFTSGPTYRTLPAVDWSDMSSDEQDKAVGYFEGSAPWAIALVALAVVTCLAWLLFCLARCGFDSCGARHATQHYKRKEINLLRLAVLVMTALMTLCFGIALAANGGVSLAVDGMFVRADALVNYLYGYREVVVSAAGVAKRAVASVELLNATIRSVLPTQHQVTEYKACFALGYDIISNQRTLEAQIEQVYNITRRSDILQEAGLHLAQMNVSVAALPNLNLLQHDLASLNTTLGSLPSLAHLSADLSSLNTSLSILSTAGGTAASISLIGARAAEASAASASSRPPLVSRETGYATLPPDLPQLHSDVTATGAAATGFVKARLQINLGQLQDALTAFPPARAALLADRLTDLRSSLYALNDSLEIKQDIIRVRDAMDALPSLSALNASLISVRSFRRGGHVARVAQRVESLLTPLASLPELDSLMDVVQRTEELVLRLKLVDLAGAARALISFNRTVVEMSCLLPVFSTLEAINTTLFEMPESVQSIFRHRDELHDQISRVDAIQNSITQGVDSILTLNATIATLPDFDDIYQKLRDVNTTLNSIPDQSEGLNQLRQLNASLASIPPISPYVDHLAELQRALSNSSLDPLLNAIDAIQAGIHALPPIDPFIANALEWEAATSGLEPLVADAIVQVDDPGYESVGITDPPRTQLAQGVMAIADVQAGQGNGAGLLAALIALEAAVAVLPNTTSLSAGVSSTATAAQSFPSTEPLSTTLADTDGNISGQDTLRRTVEQDSLSSFQSSLSRLPDLGSTSADAYRGFEDAQSTNLTSILDDIRQGDGDEWLQAEDVDEANDRLDEVASFDARLRDVDGAIEPIRQRGADISEAEVDMRTYRNDYYKWRNQAEQDWVENHDRLRLLILNGLLLVPLCLYLCTGLSALCKRGGLSMCVALTFFPTIALFLILAAVHFPVASVFADHCPEATWDSTLRLQVSGFNISRETFSQVVKLSADITSEDLFDYLALCNGPEPEIVTALREPGKILAAQGVNFTQEIDKVSNFSSSAKLRPGVVSILTDLRRLEGDLIATAGQLVRQLQCNESAAVYQPIGRHICTQFAGNVSLLACMFLLIAVCSLPGICIGIRGYKRFNPLNAYEELEEEEEDEAARANGAEEGEEYVFSDIAAEQQPEGQGQGQEEPLHPPGAEPSSSIEMAPLHAGRVG